MSERVKENLKKVGLFIVCLLIPLGVGGIAFLLIKDNLGIYDTLNLPFFAPPSNIFSIIWPILYTIMGVSLFLVIIHEKKIQTKSVVLFLVQLFFNFMWPIAFFNWKLFLFSAVWLVALIGLVAYMIYDFSKSTKWAGIIQIPYIAWLVFACILNFTIFFMNM